MLLWWVAILRVRSFCMLDSCLILYPYFWYQEYKSESLAIWTFPPTILQSDQLVQDQFSTRWSLPWHSCTWRRRPPVANPDCFWRDSSAAPSTYHHSYKFLRVRREALPSLVFKLVTLLNRGLKGCLSAEIFFGNDSSELHCEFGWCPNELVDDLVCLEAQFNFALCAS